MTISRLSKMILLSIFVVLFQNCGSENSKSSQIDSQSVREKANFPWINSNIVRPVCLECHNGSLAFSGLDFSTYGGVMEAVEPGDPQNSLFYTRSFSTKFFSLTNEEKEIIRVWIEEGAEVQ